MSIFTRIIFIITIIALFVGCAFVVIVYAAGYKIDIQNRNISKTALISVDVDPSDSQVFLNGNLIGTGSQTIRNVDAGDYVLEVKKPNYRTFTKNIDAQEGQAIIILGAQLFMEQPLEQALTKDFNQEDLANLSDNENLTSLNDELRFKGELITRLSQPISGMSWFPNKNYIAFTSAGRLKLIATDGTNLIDILDKDSTSPVIFTKSGKSVIYENQGKILEAKIR